MKLPILAVVAGMTSLGVFSWNGATPDIDPVVSGTVARNGGQMMHRVYSVANIAEHTVCLVERGEKLSGRSLKFNAGPDCDQVWPGLSAARTWTENGDGTIVLANVKGEAIITVAESDGLAYEALDPPNALLTLDVAN